MFNNVDKSVALTGDSDAARKVLNVRKGDVRAILADGD